MRTLVLLGLLVAAPAVAGAQPADEGNGATRLIRDVAGDYKNFLSIDTAEVLGVGGFAAGAIAADSSIAETRANHNQTNLVGGRVRIAVSQIARDCVVEHCVDRRQRPQRRAGRDLLPPSSRW